MMTDMKFLEIELHAEEDRSRKPHEGARHGGETIPESALTANTLREFVMESPTMEQTMPKFPTMGNIVTKSPWRKVPRRRQPCGTAPTRENTMPERPFPRDLARIGLEGGNDDDGQDLSGELHAEEDRPRESHEGACHGGETIPESVTTVNTLPELVKKRPLRTAPRWSRSCQSSPRWRRP